MIWLAWSGQSCDLTPLAAVLLNRLLHQGTIVMETGKALDLVLINPPSSLRVYAKSRIKAAIPVIPL